MRLHPVSSCIVAGPALTPTAALSVQTGVGDPSAVRVVVAEACSRPRGQVLSAQRLSSVQRATCRLAPCVVVVCAPLIRRFKVAILSTLVSVGERKRNSCMHARITAQRHHTCVHAELYDDDIQL